MLALDLDLDIELMVGEMPATPCESPHHGDGQIHQGDATHYAVNGHACFGPIGPVFAICGAYAAYWQETTFSISQCLWCGVHVPEADYVHVIAPINV